MLYATPPRRWPQPVSLPVMERREMPIPQTENDELRAAVMCVGVDYELAADVLSRACMAAEDVADQQVLAVLARALREA